MTDRATFEAHFGLTLRQQQRHKDDRYTDPITQARWEGWQAAQSKGSRTVLQEWEAQGCESPDYCIMRGRCNCAKLLARSGR